MEECEGVERGGGSLIQLIQIGAAVVVLMKRERNYCGAWEDDKAPFATVSIEVYDEVFYW